jgi:hypothetical protein
MSHAAQMDHGYSTSARCFRRRRQAASVLACSASDKGERIAEDDQSCRTSDQAAGSLITLIALILPWSYCDVRSPGAVD